MANYNMRFVNVTLLQRARFNGVNYDPGTSLWVNANIGREWVDTDIAMVSHAYTDIYNNGGVSDISIIDKLGIYGKSLAPKLYLPNKTYAIDSGQYIEFYHTGFVNALNEHAYHVHVDTSAIRHPDKFKVLSWVPTPQKPINVTLLNPYNGDIIDKHTTTLFSYTKIPNASSVKNILYIGDSLTADGTIPKMMSDWITANSLGNYRLIGSQTRQTVLCEAYGGWTWDDYIKKTGESGNSGTPGNPITTSNPFWPADQPSLSFHDYMTRNGISGNIDYASIILGANNFFVFGDTPEQIKVKAMQFLDLLKSEYPGIKVILGAYPAVRADGKDNESATVLGWNYYLTRRNMVLGMMYQEIAEDPKYSSWVMYAPISCHFDIKYGMPQGTRPVSDVTTTVTETYCTDDVHPATLGYNQMGKSVINTFNAMVRTLI